MCGWTDGELERAEEGGGGCLFLLPRISSSGCWWLMYGWLVALSQPEYERVSLGRRGGRDGGGGRWQAIDQTRRDEQHGGQPPSPPPRAVPGGHFGPEK